MNMIRALVFAVMIARINPDAQGTGEKCFSPQYLEIGKTGTIECYFPNGFFAVLWYNQTDFERDIPTVTYQNLIKTGAGYESGEYDVDPNGSLIINDTSLKHEQLLRVAYIRSKKADYEVLTVRVIVEVKPAISFPVISHCGNRTNICFAKIQTPIVECSILGAKPCVLLQLIARTKEGDRNVSGRMSVASKGKIYNSYVKTSSVFDSSPLLVLLVCKASSLEGILKKNESLILARNGGKDFTQLKAVTIYIERHKGMELNCTNATVGFISWEKATSSNIGGTTVLAYSIFIGKKFTEIQEDGVSIGSNNTLIVPSIEIKHEGKYICFFGDGVSDDVTAYNVSVFVYPVPPYPVIDGCSHQRYCVLAAQTEGSLKCTVKGIRPQVHLQWRTFHNRDETYISFAKQEESLKDNGETFDIVLTTTYNVTSYPSDRITLECAVTSMNRNLFDLASQVNLMFEKDTLDTQNLGGTTLSLKGWMIPCVIALCVLLVGSGMLIRSFSCECRLRHTTKNRKDTREEYSMVTVTLNHDGPED